MTLPDATAGDATADDAAAGDATPLPDDASMETGTLPTPDADMPCPMAPPDRGRGVSPATVLTNCMELCAERRVMGASAGFCPVGMFGGMPCLERCTELGSFSEMTERAAEACLRSDPLCFQSIDTCIMQGRYPEGTEFGVQLSATGFDSLEGRDVVAGVRSLEGSFPTQSTQVCDGDFHVVWRMSGRPIESAFEFGAGAVYIDANMNGMCDASGDSPDPATQIDFMFTGDFDAPYFVGRLSPPIEMIDRVCARFM